MQPDGRPRFDQRFRTRVRVIRNRLSLARGGRHPPVCAYPDALPPIHGGYRAPWVLALTCRRVEKASTIVTFSWVMAVLVWCAILANLGVLDWHGTLQHLEGPGCGIVQRSLFFACCSLRGSPGSPEGA